MASVLQPWVETLPIKMQSTVLLSLRGPDTHCAPHIKQVQRWMRGQVFRPGDPGTVTVFMCEAPPELQEKGPLARELEFSTQHFYSHLMHGLEVLAYRHPDYECKAVALKLFQGMCSLFHLPVENNLCFELRLRTLKWPGGGQPDNYEQAAALMAGVSGE